MRTRLGLNGCSASPFGSFAGKVAAAVEVFYGARVQSPISIDPTNVLGAITSSMSMFGAMSDRLATQGPITTAATNILSTITDTAAAS